MYTYLWDIVISSLWNYDVETALISNVPFKRWRFATSTHRPHRHGHVLGAGGVQNLPGLPMASPYCWVKASCPMETDIVVKIAIKFEWKRHVQSCPFLFGQEIIFNDSHPLGDLGSHAVLIGTTIGSKNHQPSGENWWLPLGRFQIPHVLPWATIKVQIFGVWVWSCDVAFWDYLYSGKISGFGWLSWPTCHHFIDLFWKNSPSILNSRDWGVLSKGVVLLMPPVVMLGKHNQIPT